MVQMCQSKTSVTIRARSMDHTTHCSPASHTASLLQVLSLPSSYTVYLPVLFSWHPETTIVFTILSFPFLCLQNTKCGKEPLLLGFSSVRVLSNVKFWFCSMFLQAQKFGFCSGSVRIFFVLSSVRFNSMWLRMFDSVIFPHRSDN